MISRERKKIYIKNLEVKNKHMEMECRRLDYTLRCCMAENLALRQSLQFRKNRSCGASVAKQESAVLFMGKAYYEQYLGLLIFFFEFVAIVRLFSKLYRYLIYCSCLFSKLAGNFLHFKKFRRLRFDIRWHFYDSCRNFLQVSSFKRI